MLTEESIEHSGVYTIEQLRKVCRGQLRVDGVQYTYRQEPALVRYLPWQVADKAKELFNQNVPAADIALYLNSAFYYFRACVNRDTWDVPHVIDDGCYQWPTPEEFSWDDLEKVVEAGRFVHSPSRAVQVINEEDEHVTEVDVSFGRALRRGLKKVEVEVLRLGETVRFQIPPLDTLAVDPDATEWQTRLLRAFSNPLHFIEEDARNGTLAEQDARSYLARLLDNISPPYFESVGVVVPKIEWF